jgi:hypothetical protein
MNLIFHVILTVDLPGAKLPIQAMEKNLSTLADFVSTNDLLYVGSIPTK